MCKRVREIMAHIKKNGSIAIGITRGHSVYVPVWLQPFVNWVYPDYHTRYYYSILIDYEYCSECKRFYKELYDRCTFHNDKYLVRKLYRKNFSKEKLKYLESLY